MPPPSATIMVLNSSLPSILSNRAFSMWLCQVNSPRGTMPGCTFDDPATFGIAFRLKSSATPSGCITDTA